MPTEILRPNGAGSETAIQYQTPSSGAHWDKVDEATPDDGTTYVYNGGGTGYLRDLYDIPAHSTGSGVINSVKIYFRCYIVGDGRAKPSLRTHDTTYDGTEVSTPYAWTIFSQTWTTNPNTGLAWTWDEIDALAVGVSVKRPTSGDAANCTQVYAEVDYTAVTEKTSSDTGSGADGYVSLETGEAKASSDTGSGLDDTPIPSAILSGSETGSSIDAITSRLLVSFDSGAGVEAGGVEIVGLLRELLASELGWGCDLLTAKIEMPSKGGGMKLWT